jgi:ubiquinone/menaquinone biosynthesis C-methylase UbiE
MNLFTPLRNLRDKLLAQRFIYELWQSPFAEAKIAPVLRCNDLSQVRRVLDVGCGPGTNTRHFLSTDYLGVDINPNYIRHAQQRYQCRFRVADVNSLQLAEDERFDFVLINSLLHHLSDADVRALLRKTAAVTANDGCVHILELVLPKSASVARWLARWDRGEFARPIEHWRALLTESFEPVLVHPYALTGVGVPLWNMLYFKGRPQR